MGAAGQIGGDAFGQRGAAGGNGRPGRAAGAFDHAGTPRKADGFLGLFGQSTAGHGLDVVGVVGAAQFKVAGGVRQVEIVGRKLAAGQQGLAQPGIFLHRKTMPGRQGQHEDIGVEQPHGRCLREVG